MILDRNSAVSRTRDHYDAFPFIEGGERRIARWVDRLQPLLADVDRPARALDVGCGSGEVTQALAKLGFAATAIDLTFRAARSASRVALPAVQADALRLPINDRGVDVSIAVGVLHHTPDCRSAFVELTRVTRRRMVILLYRRWTPYHLAYRLMAPVRARVPVRRVRTMPRWLLEAFRLLIQPQVRTKLNDEQLCRVIADQFWTPTATFHSPREIKRWAKSCGFAAIRARRSLFYSFTLVLERTALVQEHAVSKTKDHYERFPFVEAGAQREAHWSRRLHSHLPARDARGAEILDAGCGSGDIASALHNQGGVLTCVDLTRAAATRVHLRLPSASVCQASVLELPFRDGAFEHTISIGVLHHTPDALQALRELRRVTRQQITILVYAKRTPYHLAYVVTRPFRHVDVSILDSLPRWVLSPMSISVRLQRRQRLETQQLRRLLADQFWTPIATFHTMRELREWARELDLSVVSHTHLIWHANLVTLQPGGSPAR